MHPTPPAVLLGSDSLTGLQIARILWRRGVPVIGVADDVTSPYCRTRAVARTLSAATLDIPENSLGAIAREYGQRPVVLACTDEHAFWLNRHRDLVADFGDVLLPAPDTLDMLADKSRFYRYVAAQGLSVPETRFVRSPDEVERAAREMSFPLVVKPPRRTAAWFEASNSSKVIRVDGPEELRHLAPTLQAAAGELILQSWVRGPDTQSREFSFCIGPQNELLAGVVLQKLRQWEPGTGTGTLAVQVEDDEVIARSVEILQNLAYRGVGQLEFKRDEIDGRLFVIEMNAGRAALNLPLCEASGVEMTYLWYCAASGQPLPLNRQVTRPGAKWICWKRDLVAALFAWRRSELTTGQWIRSLRGHKWSADVRLDDPLPLLLDLRRKAARGCSQAAARMRRRVRNRFSARQAADGGVERRPPVVLLGIDRLVGLQLARIFWQHGIPLIGIAVDPDSHYCRSRAARQIVAARDFERDPARLLQDLAARYSARPVVIPCLDESVWWLNEHRDLVAEHADFLLPSAENLERLADKSRFYRHAIEHDLPLPPTRFVSTLEQLEHVSCEIRYPVVIKPPRRSHAWMQATGGFKVLRADDPATLLRTGAKLFGATDELILQDWVEGGDDCMYSLLVCFDERSNPATSSVVAHKLRQWPPDIGVGSLAEEVSVDAVVESGHRLLQDLGYVGVGSLQWKRDRKTGQFFIIEMNTRFTLGSPLFEACGVEATLSHYCLAARLPLPQSRSISYPGRKWICWKRDLASAYLHWKRGELSVGDWLRSVRGRKRSADFWLSDPLPMLIDIGRKLRNGLSRSARETMAGWR